MDPGPELWSKVPLARPSCSFSSAWTIMSNHTAYQCCSAQIAFLMTLRFPANARARLTPAGTRV